MVQTVAPHTVCLEPLNPPPAVNSLPWQVSWRILSHAQSRQSSCLRQNSLLRTSICCNAVSKEPKQGHPP